MLLLDIFESVELERLLQQSVDVQRMSLNSMGFADVLIYAHDGHRIQIENKQVDELLGGLDSCEDQLRRQYEKAEESALLVRGIAVPDVDGIQTFRESTKGRQIFHKNRKYKQSYAGYRAWLWGLDKVGITVVEVPSLTAAAVETIAIYNFAQKAEHGTLHRYIKPKIFVKDRNPHVLMLMGVPGANIGEKMAKELLRVFGTPFDVFCRSVEELSEVERMGPQLARRLLRGVGRE